MSILIYRIFLVLYRFAAVLISPVNKKAKLWLSGRNTVFADLEAFARKESRPVIWCHCASLGEFEQARPLLEALRLEYPACRLLLTFFSPSGYEYRKDYAGADLVTYLPHDSAANASRFLQLVDPTLVVWVKYEYWHFFLQAIHRKRIPLMLVSGIFRPSQPFFKPWGSFHRNMLSCFSWLFVQNQESKKLLGSIGFSGNVWVSGDTRFDRVIAVAEAFEPVPLVDAFVQQHPVIVAGSTWEEDEEELDHFANTQPGIKFIIAPHEIDESRLKDIEKLFQHTVRFSALANGELHPQANTLIIDNIGMLSRLYHYATVSYVGGGFGEDGVHNVLEAAVYGKPVVFGPVFEKYAEAVGLVEAGGAFDIENALELEDRLQLLLNPAPGSVYEQAGSKAAAFVYANKGATASIVRFIQEKRLFTS